MIVAPFFDLTVVTAEQDIRDCMAAKIDGSGIYGRGEELILEGIEKGGCFIVQNPRQEPSDGIHDHCRCEFSAAEDVIPNADLSGHPMLADTFIDAFVMSAYEQ